MSATTHVQRCREWIQEQLDAMGTLRTANTRDLAFKNWRQNTVTLLQRIWPEDRERVERFRRIVFTPPHSRADAKLSREWFGKGIGESRTYLNSLLDLIDREGVPAPAEADRERESEEMESEVGFPMLDLSGEPSREEATEAPAARTQEAGGLDVTPGYTTPDDQGATPRDPRAPAPPSLNLQWKAPSLSDLKHREGPLAETPPALGESSDEPDRPGADDERPAIEIPRAPSLPPAPAPPVRREPASRVVARGKSGRGKGKKSAGKAKLKDLLGLSEFDARAQEPAAAAAPPAPPVPVVAAREAAPAAAPPVPPAVEREAPPAAAFPPAPKRQVTPAAAVPPAPRPEAAPVAAPVPPPDAAPAPPSASAPADRGDDSDEVDDADRERATLDFMQNSPVFGVIGKPVQRRTDTTEFLDPDAVAVATLVVDLGRLGVPDGMKASLGTRLVDVAKRLEAGDLDWALLRAAVTDAMQYPELAKRLLPVLLPWLERAA